MKKDNVSSDAQSQRAEARRTFFARIAGISERSNLSPEVAESLVNEVVRQVRETSRLSLSASRDRRDHLGAS